MSEQNRPGPNGPLNEEHGGSEDPGRLGQARERFARVADQVRGRVGQAGRATGERARRTGDDLRRGAEIARERASVTGDNLRQGYHRAEERARVFSGDVDDFVQENPARAVLLAAGIGFLIGLLARRRD
jgi:ElaB/YqjD/DUF883 family membrane-anchored ribosome-binding protein